MSGSLRHALRLAWPVVALLALASVGEARAAAQATLTLHAPDQAVAGDPVSVEAELVEASGSPVPGATLVFWAPVSFLGTADSIELGRVVTDSHGRASFTYRPRGQGTLTLHAYFAGDEAHEMAAASVEITVLGVRQLYRESAGVRVPGVGVWMLAAVLTGVWALYLVVMGVLFLIARDGRNVSPDLGPRYG